MPYQYCGEAHRSYLFLLGVAAGLQGKHQRLNKTISPKGTNFKTITNKDLAFVVKKLNHRSR